MALTPLPRTGNGAAGRRSSSRPGSLQNPRGARRHGRCRTRSGISPTTTRAGGTQRAAAQPDPRPRSPGGDADETSMPRSGHDLRTSTPKGNDTLMLSSSIRLRSIAWRAAVIPAGLLLVAAAISAAPSASAQVTLVNCSGGSAGGTLSISPPLTTVPAVLSNLEGSYDFTSCTGTVGVAAADDEFSGTIVAGTCVPITNTLLGTLNIGEETLTWTGGTGAPTSTVIWTVPAATQLGPSTSVIVLVGAVTSGRFYSSPVPAIITLTITVTNPTPACPGTDMAQLTDGQLTVVSAT